jgi:hypothetical protein
LREIARRAASSGVEGFAPLQTMPSPPAPTTTKIIGNRTASTIQRLGLASVAFDGSLPET